MKAQNFSLIRYDADNGYVFDWKEARFVEVLGEDGEAIKQQEHLYVKTLFIGGNDNIDNYIEVPEIKI